MARTPHTTLEGDSKPDLAYVPDMAAGSSRSRHKDTMPLDFYGRQSPDGRYPAVRRNQSVPPPPSSVPQTPMQRDWHEQSTSPSERRGGGSHSRDIASDCVAVDHATPRSASGSAHASGAPADFTNATAEEHARVSHSLRPSSAQPSMAPYNASSHEAASPRPQQHSDAADEYRDLIDDHPSSARYIRRRRDTPAPFGPQAGAEAVTQVTARNPQPVSDRLPPITRGDSPRPSAFPHADSVPVASPTGHRSRAASRPDTSAAAPARASPPGATELMRPQPSMAQRYFVAGGDAKLSERPQVPQPESLGITPTTEQMDPQNVERYVNDPEWVRRYFPDAVGYVHNGEVEIPHARRDAARKGRSSSSASKAAGALKRFFGRRESQDESER